MTRYGRALMAAAVALHLWIGATELLVPELDPYHKPSAWQVLFYQIGLPEPLWGAAWLLVGLAMAAGLWSAAVVRVALYASSGLFGLWALGSLISFYQSLGASLAQTLALGYMAVLQAAIASFVLDLARLSAREREAEARLAALERQMERVLELRE